MARPRGPKQSISISCVICAYNEAATIAGVLIAVRNLPYISEIIVVDDGSTDGTGDIVGSFVDVQLLSSPVNLGKTHALATGIAHASGDHILTLDADLIGLTPDAITALIEPILTGRADVSLSLRANSLALYSVLGLDFVSGERVFPAGLLKPHMKRMQELPRWGAEVFINALFTENKLAISVVRWPNVINRRKADKIGAWSGLLAELTMTMDIFQVLSPATVITQNFEMLRLCRADARSPIRLAFGNRHSEPVPI